MCCMKEQLQRNTLLILLLCAVHHHAHTSPRTHNHRSSLTCCGEKGNYYSEGHTASATPGYAAPYLRIGACDWDIDVDLDYTFIPGDGATPSDLKARRIGTAWATW